MNDNFFILNQKASRKSLKYDYNTLYGQNTHGLDIPYYGKLDSSNIKEFLQKWKHLAIYLSSSKRKEWEKLDDFGKYKILYSKFFNMKRNLEKGKTLYKGMDKNPSIYDYIMSVDCDVASYSDEQLNSFKHKLISILADVDTVIEIKYEEKIEAARKRVQEIEESRLSAQADYESLIQKKQQLSQSKNYVL